MKEVKSIKVERLKGVEYPRQMECSRCDSVLEIESEKDLIWKEAEEQTVISFCSGMRTRYKGLNYTFKCSVCDMENDFTGWSIDKYSGSYLLPNNSDYDRYWESEDGKKELEYHIKQGEIAQREFDESVAQIEREREEKIVNRRYEMCKDKTQDCENHHIVFGLIFLVLILIFAIAIILS